jgi:hypothetical protein
MEIPNNEKIKFVCNEYNEQNTTLERIAFEDGKLSITYSINENDKVFHTIDMTNANYRTQSAIGFNLYSEGLTYQEIDFNMIGQITNVSDIIYGKIIGSGENYIEFLDYQLDEPIAP